MKEGRASRCDCWRRAIFWRTTAEYLYFRFRRSSRVQAFRRTVCSHCSGTGVPGYSGDGGPAVAAQLAFPTGLAMGFDGSLYIADSANHAVRRISNGVIATFASVGTPVGLALDVFATLYVADAEAGTVLRFPVSGALPPLNIPASDVVRAPDLSLYFAESAAGIVRAHAALRRDCAGGRRSRPRPRRWRSGHSGVAESSQRRGRGRFRQPVYRRP